MAHEWSMTDMKIGYPYPSPVSGFGEDIFGSSITKLSRSLTNIHSIISLRCLVDSIVEHCIL